jgi:SprT protein
MNVQLEHSQRTIDHWFRLWSVPHLMGKVTVRVNPRLKVTLARAKLERLEIHIHAELAVGAPDELREALCHEAAHLAAYELHGPHIRPHGPEWAALMRVADHDPRVRIRCGTKTSPTTARREAFMYEHRCPVCQFVRYSRRPVQAWRCRECRDAGLDGRLVISSHRRSET